jgi:hypothetical protein
VEPYISSELHEAQWRRRPEGRHRPGDRAAISAGFHKFEEDFKKAAVEQFGSGWAWLVADKGKLKITQH